MNSIREICIRYQRLSQEAFTEEEEVFSIETNRGSRGCLLTNLRRNLFIITSLLSQISTVWESRCHVLDHVCAI